MLINISSKRTKEHFEECFKKAKEGDLNARNEIIQMNYPLIVKIAKRYGKTRNFEDLVQEGTFGLIEAINRYDPQRGEFSTCAYHWIRREITKARREDRLIRIPVYLYQLVPHYRRAHQTLVEKLHREPSFEEIRNEMGTTDRKLKKVLLCIQSDSHSRIEVNKNTEGEKVDFTLADEKEKEPSDKLIHFEDKDKLEDAFRKLDSRSQLILNRRFNEGKTLDEVGSELNLTRERIRQIEATAIKQLKKISC